MSIDNIGGFSKSLNLTGDIGNQSGGLRQKLLEQAQQSFTPDRLQESFPNRLEAAVNSVADSQNQAARSARDFELGIENDLTKVMINQQVMTKVMINQQVSSLGFQMTLNVRNKVLSAYKDIMNMPV